MVPLKLAPEHEDLTNTHRVLPCLVPSNFLTCGHQTQSGECALMHIKLQKQLAQQAR